MILWTTNESNGNETQSIQAEDQDAPGAVGGGDGEKIDGSIENLSTIAKLAKSKKPKLTKTKKSDFVKTNSFETDFLTPEAKKAFIHLQKAFTEILILRHFDLEHHIQIETDALRYTIGGVLSQITLDQPSFNHVTHKNYSDFSESEIG